MPDHPHAHEPTFKALASAVADAHAERKAIRIHGAGTWLHAGRPIRHATALSTESHSGAIEYVPGDLVITVRAGTTLAEIAAITATHDQWLALDPLGSPASLDRMTIGACVATASSGPLAHGFGRIRDLVLGLSFIAGDGSSVRAGGRVVKNVAGFDLVRLSTGAWGTLGVITDVSLRLHARPAVDRTFVIAIDAAANDLQGDAARTALIKRLNDPPLLATTSTLSSLLVVAGETPLHLSAVHGIESSPALLVARAMGNNTRVEAQFDALRALGRVTEVDASIWRTIRSLGEAPTSYRVTSAPIETAASWHRAEAWCVRHETRAHMLIEPLRGLVRVMSSLAGGHQHAFELPARAIAEQLPAGAWSLQSAPTDDPISRHIRQIFDPSHILNPGIFGDA